MAASVAQLVEHRSRKAGVTGSSPVAGSIAQDSRLRAAFLLPILSAHAPTQASPRRQLPYSKTETPPNVVYRTKCLLLSRRGPDAQRWRRVEAAGRPRRRSRRLHSRRHASLVLNCPALARCNSISCYRILKERSNRSVWPDANCPGTASGSTLFYFRPLGGLRVWWLEPTIYQREK